MAERIRSSWFKRAPFRVHGFSLGDKLKSFSLSLSRITAAHLHQNVCWGGAQHLIRMNPGSWNLLTVFQAYHTGRTPEQTCSSKIITHDQKSIFKNCCWLDTCFHLFFTLLYWIPLRQTTGTNKPQTTTLAKSVCVYTIHACWCILCTNQGLYGSTLLLSSDQKYVH